MCFAVFSRSRSNCALLRSAQFGLQSVRDGFCDFALDGKNVGYFPIERVRPEVSVSRSFDQLHINSHLIGRTLYAAFQNIRDAQLLGDLKQVIRRAFETLRGGARNYFQISNLRQPREDLLLNAIGKVSVVRIAAQVFEWKNRD